jgi:parallel beta-helix repeat protein
VEGNTSCQNWNDGIQLLGSSCTTVTGNWVLGNGGDGISVYGDNIPVSQGGFGPANNNLIAGNVIAFNAGNGVTVDLASGTKVVSNVIFDNGGDGVAIQDGSSSTTLAFNFIDADDGTTAISVTDSTGTHTVCNFVSN